MRDGQLDGACAVAGDPAAPAGPKPRSGSHDREQRSEQDHERRSASTRLRGDDPRRGDERRERDQRRGEQPRSRSPAQASARVLVRAAEHGRDRERQRPDAGDEEAAASSRSSTPPLDREADAGEDRDDRRREHDRRVEHEPRLRQRRSVLRSAGLRQEERRGRRRAGRRAASSPTSQRLERVLGVSLHVPLIGSGAVLPMRGQMAERILVVDDHPLTRDALVVAAARRAASTSSARRPTAPRRSSAPPSSSPISSCSTSRCPGWTGSTALPRLRAAAPAARSSC